MTEAAALKHALCTTLAILAASCSASKPPEPLLKIEGAAVPPSADRARVEPDGTVVLERTP